VAGNAAAKRVGVLALQGDFERHEAALRRAGASPVNVRTAQALAEVDGLIIPGGESTTMLKLIGYEQLWDPLAEFLRVKPVFGTCAGAILLAREVESPKQASFGVMDIAVERNAYGRQIDSHIAQLDLNGQALEAVFIRAPIIRRVGDTVEVLASHRGDPVLVRQGRLMAATFHPELTCDPRVHELFLQSL
jgi:5'-phosphate synthase pdxT subunit